MKPEIVAIGCSAGGVDALRSILRSFKKPSKLSVLVVIHFHPEGPNLIPSLYQDECEFNIKEADSGEKILPETIYIAPPDYHLSAEENHTLSLSTEEPVNFSRPSIDVLMDSVALSFGKKAMGILLTGASNDGSQGMLKIHKKGGITLVQDPQDAEYSTMPLSCLDILRPTKVLSLRDMANYLSLLSEDKHE